MKTVISEFRSFVTKSVIISVEKWSREKRRVEIFIARMNVVGLPPCERSKPRGMLKRFTNSIVACSVSHVYYNFENSFAFCTNSEVVARTLHKFRDVTVCENREPRAHSLLFILLSLQHEYFGLLESDELQNLIHGCDSTSTGTWISKMVCCPSTTELELRRIRSYAFERDSWVFCIHLLHAD